MRSNKDRLHIGLYARGGGPRTPASEATYHWALIVGPKAEGETQRGIRYHAKQKFEQDSHELKWIFEKLEIPLYATNMLLVRITIAKIANSKRVSNILSTVPIRKDDEDWSCKAWVRDALKLLDADEEALGTKTLEWNKVHDAALSYCEEKKNAHRFDGQGGFDTTWPPTFDLMTNKELIP